MSERLARLGVNDADFSRIPSKVRAARVPMELPGLIHVCHDPILDYVVLSKRFAAGHLASFSLVDAPSPSWHVYDCTALRTLTDPYARKLSSP